MGAKALHNLRHAFDLRSCISLDPDRCHGREPWPHLPHYDDRPSAAARSGISRQSEIRCLLSRIVDLARRGVASVSRGRRSVKPLFESEVFVRIAAPIAVGIVLFMVWEIGLRIASVP